MTTDRTDIVLRVARYVLFPGLNLVFLVLSLFVDPAGARGLYRSLQYAAAACACAALAVMVFRDVRRRGHGDGGRHERTR